MRAAVLGVLLGAAGSAAAGERKPLDAADGFVSSLVIHEAHGALRFAFTPEAGVLANAEYREGGGGHWATEPKQPVIGMAANEADVAWVAFDLAHYQDCLELDGCKAKKVSLVHRAMTLLQGGRPIAAHIASPWTAKAQKESLNGGWKLTEVDKKIDKGAEDVVKRFESTIGDPKLLAASVSARPEAVLFGSEAAERWVGGDKVKAQLVKWKLGFKVNGGVQAGVTKAGAMGWVAANVDAFPIAKPAQVTPYRVTAFYEKAAAGWQLVALHFSFAENPYAGGP